jgi:hypothetical protein
VTLAAVVFTALPAFAATPTEQLTALGSKVKEVDGAIVELQVEAEKFTEVEYKLVGSCTKLRKLNVNGKTLNDQNLALLAGLTELEELSTNQTSLTDDGYKHFTAFKKLKSLALFHPSWASKEFTGKGLAHLKNCPNLRRLTFAGSTAGDEAMIAVGQITQLADFSTWHTAQTQAGNDELLKLPNLTSLRMGQRLPKYGTTSPASFDAETIKTIAKMKSIESLEIFEARLTFDALKPLKDLPKLKKIKIHEVDIADADIDQLKKHLPGVTIDFKPLTPEERESLAKKLKL